MHAQGDGCCHNRFCFSKRVLRRRTSVQMVSGGKETAIKLARFLETLVVGTKENKKIYNQVHTQGDGCCHNRFCYSKRVSRRRTSMQTVIERIETAIMLARFLKMLVVKTREEKRIYKQVHTQRDGCCHNGFCYPTRLDYRRS